MCRTEKQCIVTKKLHGSFRMVRSIVYWMFVCAMYRTSKFNRFSFCYSEPNWGPRSRARPTKTVTKGTTEETVSERDNEKIA